MPVGHLFCFGILVPFSWSLGLDSLIWGNGVPFLEALKSFVTSRMACLSGDDVLRASIRFNLNGCTAERRLYSLVFSLVMLVCLVWDLKFKRNAIFTNEAPSLGMSRILVLYLSWSAIWKLAGPPSRSLSKIRMNLSHSISKSLLI